MSFHLHLPTPCSTLPLSPTTKATAVVLAATSTHARSDAVFDPTPASPKLNLATALSRLGQANYELGVGKVVAPGDIPVGARILGCSSWATVGVYLGREPYIRLQCWTSGYPRIGLTNADDPAGSSCTGYAFLCCGYYYRHGVGIMTCLERAKPTFAHSTTS
ncbi:hypothetical protein FPV67DRAFT_1653858 [Lyophyllum atratum]|nr:hypothetical protein FPV67DRAFT_1653858 [Lyophyllum atratum]